MPRTPPGPPCPPCAVPPRHKLALLTFLGLLGPVSFVPPFWTARLPDHPFWVVVLAVATIVPLMTYLIMPALLWVFAGWLRPPAPQRTG